MAIDQWQLIAQLHPLRRDIVSDGFDEALRILAERFPLDIHRYETGTPCWTWRVPAKWSCDEAYVETVDGRRVIDQANHPLHVASYSCPIDDVVSRDVLLQHLHVHPHVDDQPPFIFHYYQRNWGFCCGRSTREDLREDMYHVAIRSRFEPGELKVAEYHLPGERDDCFVLCGHLCHPGQVNDGLSGVVTGLAVMDALAAMPTRRYSYRLLVVPETIGSIAWLSHHEHLLERLVGGLFLEMTGLRQSPALQLSFNGDTQVDRCLRHVHLASDAGAWCGPHRSIVGNDERQFNAPGVRVPMLSYSRSLPGEHPLRPFREYHSAADNLDITCPAMLEQSKATVLAMIDVWERNRTPCNNFRGEICLANFDLAVDRHQDLTSHRTMLNIMDLIDGTRSIIDIADRLVLPFAAVADFVDRLEELGLVYSAGTSAIRRPGSARRETRAPVAAGP
jgi:aminopeptidase-like protein